jgi:hypothetical protein
MSPEPPSPPLTGGRPPVELTGTFPVPLAPNAPPLPEILPVLLLHPVKRTIAPKRNHALHSGIVAVPRLLAVEISTSPARGSALSRYDTGARDIGPRQSVFDTLFSARPIVVVASSSAHCVTKLR